MGQTCVLGGNLMDIRKQIMVTSVRIKWSKENLQGVEERMNHTYEEYELCTNNIAQLAKLLLGIVRLYSKHHVFFLLDSILFLKSLNFLEYGFFCLSSTLLIGIFNSSIYTYIYIYIYIHIHYMHVYIYSFIYAYICMFVQQETHKFMLSKASC